MIAPDRMRLEVQTDLPAGTLPLPNLIVNPPNDEREPIGDTSTGTWGWEVGDNGRLRAEWTPLPVPQLSAFGLYATGRDTRGSMRSDPAAVLAGQRVAARCNVVALPSGSVTLAIEFYNAAGALISSVASAATTTTGVLRRASATAPTGTVAMRARIQYDRSDTNNTDPALFREIMLTKSNAAIPADFAYQPEVTWVDIIGPAHELRIERNPLGLSQLTGTLYDAALDPANTTTVRPGKRIRLLVNVAAAGRPANWQPVFTGRTFSGTSAYADKTSSAVRVELVAVDAASILGNQKEPNTRVASSQSLRALRRTMNGKGAAFAVGTDTYSDQEGSDVYQVVAVNEAATVLDQVAIARDSFAAIVYAWISRRNVLKAIALPNLQARRSDVWPTRQLSDRAGGLSYTTIDVGWSTDECINDVTVNFLRYQPIAGQTSEIAYGPYRNQDSIDQWGARTATVTVAGPTESDAACRAVADVILNANANPVVRARSMTLRAKTDAEVEAMACVDHYDAVAVTYRDVLTEALHRVSSIEHTITATKRGVDWRTTWGFVGPESAPPPISTPPPPAASGAGTQTAPGTVIGGEAAGTIPAGSSYVDVAVSFGVTFGATPAVIVGSMTNSARHFPAQVVARNTTGFTLRLFRFEGSATTAASTPRAGWLAYGA